MRNLTEYIRAFQYLLQYCLLEMPRGLNFSLRDLSEIIDSQRHGYAMTSKKAIRNIAQKINLHEKAFLDIGSGKGYVPYQAVKFGARIAEGIEFSKKFHSIAQTNYELLQVSNVCRSNRIDATQFERYSDFDIFFLFNPFEERLYESVIDRLMTQCSNDGKKRSIICYGGANLQAIVKHDSVRLVYSGICPHRKNRLVIYTFGSI